MTLYNIMNEFKELYQLATEDSDQQAFLDTLESLKGDLEAKSAGYVSVIKQLEMEADECDKVIEEFKNKKSARKNAVKRMREALLQAMDVAGVDTLPAGNYTLKIAPNGGMQPLDITGEVPDSFMKVKLEPDTDKIRKALMDGKELEFAHLKNRGRHVNIR